MKSRSEAKAAKAAKTTSAAAEEPKPDPLRDTEEEHDEDEDEEEEETPAAKGPPKNPFQWPNVNKGKESPLREDLLRVVETIWVDDIHAEWKELEAALSLGRKKRSEHAHVVEALDKVPARADRAHRLFLTAKMARDKWEAENEPIWSAMWSEATKSLQAEKDSGTRSKQVTDADVKARVATLFPDEYRAQEDRRRAIELTVRSLERLSDIWFKKMSNAESLAAKLRG